MIVEKGILEKRARRLRVPRSTRSLRGCPARCPAKLIIKHVEPLSNHIELIGHRIDSLVRPLELIHDAVELLVEISGDAVDPIGDAAELLGDAVEQLVLEPWRGSWRDDGELVGGGIGA